MCGVAPLSWQQLVTPHTHPPWQKGFRGARLRHRCQLYTLMKPQLASRAYELERLLSETLHEIYCQVMFSFLPRMHSAFACFCLLNPLSLHYCSCDINYAFHVCMLIIFLSFFSPPLSLFLSPSINEKNL